MSPWRTLGHATDSYSVRRRRAMDAGAATKLSVLAVLVLQNALLILSMRYSRVGTGDKYITTTAVSISEVSKMLLSSLIILYQHFDDGKGIVAFLQHMHNGLIVNWKDTLKLSVPALIYAIQNNLQYVAVSNLDAAVFQVLYQLKIFTTALFSVFMLSKDLSALQWLSLCLLFGGVSMVTVDTSSAPPAENTDNQNVFIGVTAVVISCITSGFAGVYFERILKGSTESIWLRNVQLGIFGSLCAILGMVLYDGSTILEVGFFHGYTPLVWFVVSQQAVGGLIVALVIRYADNILKGYATSLSIIISAIASVYLFGFSITTLFILGTALTLIAVFLYGWKPQVEKEKTNGHMLEEEGNTTTETR